MKALSWMRARPKSLASAAGLTAGAIAIASLAMAYEGFPTTEVDLNDGGVWITKSSSLLVGHFNNESTVLDGGLRTTSESFDILQDAATVVVVDEGESTLTAVDPARVSLGDSTTIPGSAKVALGNKTTAILDTTSGDLWVVAVSALSGFEIQGTDPLVELGKDADVAVGTDGTVYAVSAAEAAVYTIPVDPQGEALEPSSEALAELGEDSLPAITAVGTTPVVLDRTAGAVMTPGGFRTELGDADGAVLQQSSAGSDAVTLASTSQLLRVPLDGSEPEAVAAGAQGAPAAPVSLLGCSYGAWGGSAKFVRDCPSADDDLTADIPDLSETAELTFRVNRDVIVLNDVVAGAAWIATDSLQQVDNWNDITPPEGDSEEDEQTTEETVETSLPERKAENTRPIAEDDSFGVRPGQTAMLPVLDNDTDADGDVLVASLLEGHPSIGTVQPINNGSALQIAVDEDAGGTSTFRYEVEDGRDGRDDATVTLSVHDWSVNAAPRAKRSTTIAVETGGTVSYNVLPDWIDPDGDDIYLKAVVPAPGDEVDFTTDGQITYRAVASLQGRKEVQVTVADGLGETAQGILTLDVRPAGSTSPKTNADHVVTRAGQQVTVAPLANDTSAGREPLRLARVDEVPDAAIVTDTASKTFTFTSAKVGVYYVQYLATAGSLSAPGLVRIDVIEASEEDLPPIAVRDVALLPAGGEVLVGVLNNDTDPGGGILVIQSVTVEPGSGISVSVLNHETLRIGDQGALTEQVRVTYRISNGSKTAEGDVIVIPIPAPDKLLPPVANDDQVIVRVGDVVTIPVLDNDTHPNDDALHVAPDLIEPFIDPEDGEAFVSQDTVRFRAGPEAKTVYLTYEVVDTMGQKDAGYVTVQILPVDLENNAAPRPRDVTVRALSGATMNIAIPLDGIDADGDSVELLGIDSSPTKGRIVETAQNYFTYEAFGDSTGVDTFTYRVRDRLGKEGTATIRVGIAPGEQANQAPYAVKDSVVVRPGREVAVPVTANDSDPEGDTITLVADGLVVPEVEGLTARVSGDRVLVQAPEEPMETSLTYTIRDARGAEATAVLQITVDEDVPLLSPIARDDRVLSSDVKEELSIDVDVLANDEDPDGTTESLELVAETGGVVLADRKVRVTLRDEMQLIRYTITDQDDLSTSAFIFVPAIADLRPIPSTTTPVEVLSGETKVLPLADYVTVAGGGSVVLTEASKVSAIHADGADLIQDERTLVYTSAEGYFGQDALTFEVTDGAGPDDPAGRKATLTIPITVLPPENQQPSFIRGEMTVAPGEPATSLDLAALTTDPDKDDEHSYTLVGSPGSGLTARVEGAQLSVEAASNTPKGTAATVTIRISDGETDPIEGTVNVRVSASTRPLATANTDTIPEADQGKTISVPVLANDVNPFEDQGPLKLLTASTVTGRGLALVKGDEVEVTPDPDFVGTMVVSYRIQDATEDADRIVDGQIVLTVQGVPDAPGTPVVSSVQDRTVVLSWTPPANNGAEITGYTVKSVQGSPYTRQCDSTTCTLDGLTNNVKYVFQVTATNRVGDSDPSRSSEEARPDARPDTPAPPTLAFGDRSLTVKWKTPTTPGSPVESYTLEISPAPPSGIGQKAGLTGNSYVWEGLENGTEYTVRVQAHNLAPEPSSWSVWSTGMIPAGPPSRPAAPTTAELDPVGTRAQMMVSWAAPAHNGDAIAGYQLQVRRGSTVVQTLAPGAGATSQAVTVDTSTTAYTYLIRAQNKAGWGEWSEASAPRRGVVAPAAPAKPKITAGDRSITVDKSSYTLSSSQLNGASASEVSYEFSLNGGGWQGNWNGTDISGLSNGSEYTVRIRAVASVTGSTYSSGASPASNAAVPFGKPPAPSASARNNGQTITLSWGPNGNNGSAITKTQISVDGGGWQDVAGSGSTTAGNGYSQTHSIKVRVQNAAGWSAEASASARTSDPPPPPQPKVWVTQGAAPANGNCVNGCRQFLVHFENLNIGTYQVYCYASSWQNGTQPISNYSFPVNFNGTGSQQISCWQGRDGVEVWIDIVGWGSSVDTQKSPWPRP